MNKSVLKNLGLSENETSIYLILLKTGSAPVSKIAEKAGMYRPYVYDTLNRLLEKSLVSFVVEDKKKFFSASHPEKLLDLLNEKKSDLEEVLPYLISLTEKNKDEPNVKLIRGKEVVVTIQKIVFSELEKRGGENLVMGVDDSKYLEYAPIYLKKFISLLERNKFKERVISSEDSKVYVGGKTSEYRFVPKQFFNPTATHIVGNLVCIIIWSVPLLGIIIESKDVADSYRKNFNILWKTAKKKKRSSN